MARHMPIYIQKSDTRTLFSRVFFLKKKKTDFFKNEYVQSLYSIANFKELKIGKPFRGMKLVDFKNQLLNMSVSQSVVGPLSEAFYSVYGSDGIGLESFSYGEKCLLCTGTETAKFPIRRSRTDECVGDQIICAVCFKKRGSSTH